MADRHTQFSIKPGGALTGTVKVPGDKSISHRSVMFGAMAGGTSQVRGWLNAGDTEATLGAVRTLGIDIERHDANTLTIHGGVFKQPSASLDFVNAGTGIRLMAGIIAGQPFECVLDGSEQLRRRPMKRIIKPLAMMGANIEAQNDRAPMRFRPSTLKAISYDMPVASAQVKSAVLLAGLFTKGATVVSQPGPSRDHTETMLSAMGVDIHTEGNRVVLKPGADLQPLNLTVPGDFSSAAFLLVAGCVVPGSDLTIAGVNLNHTRTGLLNVLREMGADITISNAGSEGGEPAGDIRVKHSTLKGVDVGGETVVRMIDEFPALMVAALHAEGRTTVRDAGELRVKETDRLAVMTAELTRLGAKIDETEDGFIIDGPQTLGGGTVDGHDDHRVAMSLSVAGMAAGAETIVTDAACAGDSFPGYAALLAGLGANLVEEPVAVG